MKWLKYSLRTTTAAVDLISGLLNDIGITGIEIEDKVPLTEADKKRMFVDILPDTEPDDGCATVHFYMEENAGKETVLQQFQEGMEELAAFIDLGDRQLTVSQTEDEDWVNNWKAFFKSFRIDEAAEVTYRMEGFGQADGAQAGRGAVVVKPTWEECADLREGDTLLEIDPGISFGTGAHETTKLCILALRKLTKGGDEILDVGCGSGILSIAAVKSGAAHAFAVDIDPVAVKCAAENIEINHISSGLIHTACGDLISDRTLQETAGTDKYDIVVANILADILIPLTPVIVPAMKQGAYYITSGIINTRKEDVRAAVEQAGLTVMEITELKDWVCITAKKK